MSLWNGRWRGKKLTRHGFLGLENLEEFCKQYGINLSQVEIYQQEPKTPHRPAEQQEQEKLLPPGPPPYGVWLTWPGFFCANSQDEPLRFPSLEAVKAWMDEQGIELDAVEVRSFKGNHSIDL